MPELRELTCAIAAMAASVILSGCATAPPPSAAHALAHPVPASMPDAEGEEGGPDPIERRTEAAVPAPKDIFDFHPKGAKPDSWRQPFVIDANDGPLTDYLRRTDRSLHALVNVDKGKGLASGEAVVGRPCKVGEGDRADKCGHAGRQAQADPGKARPPMAGVTGAIP